MNKVSYNYISHKEPALTDFARQQRKCSGSEMTRVKAVGPVFGLVTWEIMSGSEI